MHLRFPTLLVLAVLLPLVGNAQTVYQWNPAGTVTASGGAGTWDTSAEWLPNSGGNVVWPGAGGMAEFDFFSGTKPATVNLSGNTSVYGLNFLGGGYHITGSNITLGSGGISMSATDASVNLNNNQLILSGAATISNSSNTQSLDLFVGGINAQNNTLTFDGSGTIGFYTVSFNGADVFKTGSGNLDLYAGDIGATLFHAQGGVTRFLGGTINGPARVFHFEGGRVGASGTIDVNSLFYALTPGQSGGFSYESSTGSNGSLQVANTYDWFSGKAQTALQLGSATSTGLTLLANNASQPMDLNGATREVMVYDNPNSTLDYSQIDMAIVNGVLRKSGAGTLVLNNTGSSFSQLQVQSGTVEAYTINGAGLSLSGGGVLLLLNGYSLSRNVGTGISDLQWTGDGGFSSQGGTSVVALTGSTPVWGSTAGFLPNGAVLKFGSDYSSGTLVLQGNIDLGGATRTVDVAWANANGFASVATLASTLSNGGLTKTGLGTLNLSGSNTYTGGTTVSAGTLAVTSTGSLASTGGVTVNGGTLSFANTAGQTVAGISGTGGSITLGTGVTLTDNQSTNTSYAGVISGSGNLTKTGTATQTLSGANTYTGTTTITGGQLSVTTLADGGTASGLGAASSAASNLVLDGGILTLGSAPAGGSTDRLFTLTQNGGQLYSYQNGGALNFTNPGAMALTGSGSRTLVLSSFSSFAPPVPIINTFAPVLGDGTGGATSLVVSGPRVWALTGANTYTGATMVNSGTLRVDGSIASSSLTTVALGATLTGAGAIGDISLSGTYAPGNSPALVSVGNLTMTSTGILQMEIGGLIRGTDYDALNLNGALAAGGTLDVTFINSFTPTGAATFNLFDFSSGTGTFATINLPSVGSGYSWDSSALYTTGELVLNYSAIPEPSACAMLAGLGALVLAFSRRRAVTTAGAAGR